MFGVGYFKSETHSLQVANWYFCSDLRLLIRDLHAFFTMLYKHSDVCNTLQYKLDLKIVHHTRNGCIYMKLFFINSVYNTWANSLYFGERRMAITSYNHQVNFVIITPRAWGKAEFEGSKGLMPRWAL